MTKGFWEKRYDKMCESFYLIDEDRKLAYTFKFEAHHLEKHSLTPSTDIGLKDPEGILRAMAECFQQAGILPYSAVDAELKATKYHLEDMRNLTLKRDEKDNG